jgi:predicted transcriptional regulator
VEKTRRETWVGITNLATIKSEKEYLQTRKEVQNFAISIDELLRKEDMSELDKITLRALNSQYDELRANLREYDKETAADRIGAWMPTYSGKRFWLLDPRPDDIDIVDIAKGLSNQCRFNGHVKEFYSVAQHSVLAANVAPPEYRLQALMHDASESYCGDVISPLKPLLKDYKRIERKVMEVIGQKFNFDIDAGEAIVREIDERMLATEVRDLLPVQTINWKITRAPYPFKIKGWSPEMAYQNFLTIFMEITKWPNSQALNQISSHLLEGDSSPLANILQRLYALD